MFTFTVISVRHKLSTGKPLLMLMIELLITKYTPAILYGDVLQGFHSRGAG
jgi:hypothetical protein